MPVFRADNHALFPPVTEMTALYRDNNGPYRTTLLSNARGNAWLRHFESGCYSAVNP